MQAAAVAGMRMGRPFCAANGHAAFGLLGFGCTRAGYIPVGYTHMRRVRAACLRACVRACMYVAVCVRACVHACVGLAHQRVRCATATGVQRLRAAPQSVTGYMARPGWYCILHTTCTAADTRCSRDTPLSQRLYGHCTGAHMRTTDCRDCQIDRTMQSTVVVMLTTLYRLP